MVHPPKLWQELVRGMDGRDDVEAAQRGLWRAADDLGYVSHNALNGTFGEGTAADVESFRLAMSMQGDPNTIGAALWNEIWRYVDSSGRKTFCNEPKSAHPTPTAKKLPLKKGMDNKGVEACQRALWRALEDTGHARNGSYGSETAKSVNRFRDVYNVNAGDDGNSIGGDLWNVLTRWFDQTAVDLAHAWTPDPPPPSGDAMSRAVSAALGQNGYVEGGDNSNKYGSWYGMNYQPWCAMFCAWCAEQSGSNSFVKSTRYHYCPTIVNDARANRNGLKTVSAGSAKRGALCLFDWHNDGVADHVGFVVEGPGAGSSFYTCEGNTSPGSGGSQSNGGGVYQRTRYTSDVVLFATFT